MKSTYKLALIFFIICLSLQWVFARAKSPQEAVQQDLTAAGPEESPNDLPASTAGKPNIVWIMGEDCGTQHYDLFDPVHGTHTPHIDTMADSGLIFTHTFCVTAVCSAARSTLITSCYPSRLGLQWHRKIEPVMLPSDLQGFPAYLRRAGYYTTNSTKTDYNCTITEAWDNIKAGQFGWRDRPSAQTPFFHCRTYTVTHESCLFKIGKTDTDPDSITIPPHHPGTTQFRKTYATYHDRIHDLDSSVGDILNALKADGLLEDTFIFFFGDNGGTLPGSKGYITETGLHVPLVVRVPENWKHLVPESANGKIDGFITFADFGATVLHLAGLDVPAQMDGKPFLGQGITLETINARDEAFCSADRFDELYNLCRSVRKGNFKYVRNYEPFYPYSLRNNYRMNTRAFQQWKEMFQAGTLNAAQRRFFEPRKAEELYDLDTDPYETRNLAGDPAYAATLADLRNRLYQRVTGMPDLGILTEAVFLAENGTADPVLYGKANQKRIARYVDIADLMLRPYDEVSSELTTLLTSSDPLERCWAMTVCAAFGKDASALEPDVTALLETETHPQVQARAAVCLAESGSDYDVEDLMRKALKNCSTNPQMLYVLNDLIHLKDNRGYKFTGFRASHVRNPDAKEISNRIQYLGW